MSLRRAHIGWIAALLAVLAAVVVQASTLTVSDASFSAQTDTGANQLEARAVFGNDVFRVTTYQIGTGTFTGLRYTLTLQNDLEYNYFAMIEGAAGANNGTTTRGPDENFVRVVADPFTPNFTGEPETAADEIVLERAGTTGDWQGAVTIVESVQHHAVAGFTLKGVLEVDMASGVTNTVATLPGGWDDLAQVGVYAGARGGGVTSTATQSNRHQTGWARVFPSGSDQVTFERQGAAATSLDATATFTAYVVEWGSEWEIQSVLVSGNRGGNGVNAPNEYNRTNINDVVRANTFVTASGRTAAAGLGNGWEGQVFTLGNGRSNNNNEDRVAVGAEYGSDRTAQVYVHTHPDLAVDYRFGTDGGNPGIPSNSLGANVTVDGATGAETYGGGAALAYTEGRLPIISNSSNGTGNAFPRSMVAARHTANATVRWQRSRSGQPGAFWLQSADFSGVQR